MIEAHFRVWVEGGVRVVATVASRSMNVKLRRQIHREMIAEALTRSCLGVAVVPKAVAAVKPGSCLAVAAAAAVMPKVAVLPKLKFVVDVELILEKERLVQM